MSDEKKTLPAEGDAKKGSAGADFNRRDFFVKLGVGSLSIAAVGTAAFSYQFLSPNVLFEPSPIVNAGKPENYAVDSVTLDVNSGIYLIHAQEGFFSLSAVCTHLGCLTA
jgi:Rieske Fe-S protein